MKLRGVRSENAGLKGERDFEVSVGVCRAELNRPLYRSSRSSPCLASSDVPNDGIAIQGLIRTLVVSPPLLTQALHRRRRHRPTGDRRRLPSAAALRDLDALTILENSH